MRGLFDQVLRRQGQEVTLRRGAETAKLLALIQPMKRDEELSLRTGPLGRTDERLWLYLGQGPVEAGDGLDWEGMALRVRSAAPWQAGGRLSHWWAILEAERGAAT